MILTSGKRMATGSRWRGKVGAVDRGLGDKGGTGVQQHGQVVRVSGGVVPQRVEALVVRIEAGVHGEQHGCGCR